MRRTLNIPFLPAEELTMALHAHISDAQFRQAGVWQLRSVRIDLPLQVAQTALPTSQPWQRLCKWLQQQALQYQITGAKRVDVALHLEFESF
jgi:hypothetical protein